MKCILFVLLSVSPFLLEGSSLTSGMGTYRSTIEKCLQSDELYQNFRRERALIFIYEGCGTLQATKYGKVIVDRYPHLIEYCPEFQKNELLGNPQLLDCPYLGRFAPLTIRHIHSLGEITSMFDIEPGCSIAEIGCAYGGLCSVVSRVVDFGSYELIDLDFVLPFIDRYLNTLEVRNFSSETSDTCGKRSQYDLCISEYGISECYREYQDLYIEKVLQHSKRAYIVYNSLNVAGKKDSPYYSTEEFCAKLREYGIEPKVRSEVVRCQHPTPNDLIYWGEK